MEDIKNWKMLLLITTLVVTKTFAKSEEVIDEIAAIVNNNIVLKSEVDNFIKFLIKKNVEENYQVENDTKLRSQVLEHLIINKILFEIAKKSGTKISSKEINLTITNIAKQNKMTFNQMKNYLAHNNINFSSYRNQLCKEILISKISEKEIHNRITILPQEIEILAKYLNKQKNVCTKINLSYIFIPLQEKNTFNQVKKTKELINVIIEKLTIGNSSFSEIATFYSRNQKNLKYSEKKWNNLQELPAVFIRALNMAKRGDIIGPIHFGSGIYILKVNDFCNQKNDIFITKMHIRHILLKESPILTNKQIYMKLNQIASNIKNRKISFANAAKQFSEDFDSASRCGDLGWIEVDNNYNPSIRNVLIKLRKGQISSPVHSSLGWHLFELIDVVKLNRTYEIQKDQAYRILLNRKFFEEKEEWLHEQRANAYVKILRN